MMSAGNILMYQQQLQMRKLCSVLPMLDRRITRDSASCRCWQSPVARPVAEHKLSYRVYVHVDKSTGFAVQVRLAFLGMVGNWLLTLRERLDHQPRLLPYLLSGLCDESPAIVHVS
jgi:hypothetical protein